MSNRVELSIAERFPFAGGHEFGAVGAYERLVERGHFAVDPHAPAHRARHKGRGGLGPPVA